jgi:hypothetical protein
MSLNRNRGKSAERAVALILGGQRVGVLSGEDVHFDGPWSAEVKSRAAFVATGWMEQAVRNAPPGKVPIVAVHVRGKRHDDDLVLIRLSDWKAIIERDDDAA